VVGTNGNYSARLRVGGFSYPLAGALDMSGYDSEVVSRAAHGLSDLSVTLQLDTTGASGQITGLVSNMDTGNPWTALLLADLATNALPVPAGTFNMLITSAPSGTQTSGAGLSGSGWLVNSDVGQVTWAAVLPDGTFISKTVPLAKDGTIPFYAILYGGLGVAEGWINLANGVPTGSITWIHPGRAAAGQAAQGITTVLAVGSVPSLSN
jgi:hypothetical protein